MQSDRDIVAVHATAVAIGGSGILICGPSRAGKSRLAVALVASGTAARPITLIGDDRILIEVYDGRIWASPHPTISGFIERRGLGLVAVPFRRRIPVHGLCELTGAAMQPRATASASHLQNLWRSRLVINGTSENALAAVLSWFDRVRDEAQEAQCVRKAHNTWSSGKMLSKVKANRFILPEPSIAGERRGACSPIVSVGAGVSLP